MAYIVSRQQKGFALGRILEFEDPASAIVFCRTRIEVDELTDTLKSHGYGAQALHGGLQRRGGGRLHFLFGNEAFLVLDPKRVEKTAHHRPLIDEVVRHQQARSDELREILARADEAAYRAKQAGGDHLEMVK